MIMPKTSHINAIKGFGRVYNLTQLLYKPHEESHKDDDAAEVLKD